MSETNENKPRLRRAEWENQLKQSYESKISSIELQLKEQININSELDSKLKNFEKKNKEHYEKYKKLRSENAELSNTLGKELKEKEHDLEALKTQITNYQNEISNLKKTNSKLQFSINELNEKNERFEKEQENKEKRMKDIQEQLLKTQFELVLEEEDDEGMLAQIKYLKEKNAELTNQLNHIVPEHNDNLKKIQSYESKISQRNEEILLLKRQFEEYKETATKNAVIDVSAITTSETYIEIENRYNILVDERNSLNNQIEIKNNLYNEMENRYKKAHDKITSLFKTINELKATVQGYEEREIELKRNEYEFQLKVTILTSDVSQRNTKITSLENIIKQKDAKINQLNETIKQKNAKISDKNEETRKANEQVLSLKGLFEEKLKEISMWNKENEKDDAQIASLLEAINKQNGIIKGWEEENARDDAKILELESTLNRKNELILKLQESLTRLRERFAELKNTTGSLELNENGESTQEFNSFKLEVTSSAEYLTVINQVSMKEVEIKNLHAQIDDYRNELQNLIKEKNQLNATIEILKQDSLQLSKKVQQVDSIKAQVEGKITTVFSEVEQRSKSFVSANNKVSDYKNLVETKSDEVDKILAEIDQILA